MDLELALERLPTEQARVVRERTRRLGCWPDDVIVDLQPIDRPAGHIIVVAGRSKGRPRTFSIAPDGDLTVA